MRPNILFIAIDDLFDYTAFRNSFGVEIQTPNLDRLAQRSVFFDSAFATIPVCNPSRAATMTGFTANESGVFHNFEHWTRAIDMAESFPAVLRDNGYWSVTSGKIFHGYLLQTPPVNARLYSVTPTSVQESLDYSKAHHFGGIEMTLGLEGQDEGFYDRKVGNYGIEFLRSWEGGRPFLLSLGFKHPHTPYLRPMRFWDMYPPEKITVPEAWAHGSMSNVPQYARSFFTNRKLSVERDAASWRATVAGYLAGVSHVDHEIGRVLDALAASPHADTTAIVLYSDHGYHLGDKDHFHKFTLWEESARAPLIISPAGGTEGRVEHTPVSFMDIYPTILELAQVPAHPRRVGQSLLPFVEPQKGRPKHKKRVYAEGPVLTQCYGSLSIRKGSFRYIRYADESEEMYDIASDPAQNVNLALDAAFDGKRAEMEADLIAEAARHGATIDLHEARVTGTSGRDVAIATRANEELALGDGDDIYIITDPATKIIEEADGGHDKVIYAALGHFTLPPNVEEAEVGFAVSRLPDGGRTKPSDLVIVGNNLGNLIQLTGSSGSVHGGTGNDTIFGGEWGTSWINGGAGDDVIHGGKLADRLWGAEGNDRIFGGLGNDSITGGAGDDYLDGGPGDDTLIGGIGNDVLIGGAGRDVFVFSAGDGQDVIRDFDPGTDRLEFNLRLGDVETVQMTRDGNAVVVTYADGDKVRVNCTQRVGAMKIVITLSPAKEPAGGQ